jgi:hypothetical protein
MVERNGDTLHFIAKEMYFWSEIVTQIWHYFINTLNVLEIKKKYLKNEKLYPLRRLLLLMI